MSNKVIRNTIYSYVRCNVLFLFNVLLHHVCSCELFIVRNKSVCCLPVDLGPGNFLIEIKPLLAAFATSQNLLAGSRSTSYPEPVSGWGLERDGKRSEGQELTWTSGTQRREIVHVLCMKWYLFQHARKAVFEGKLRPSGQSEILEEVARRFCEDGSNRMLKL